MTIPDKHKLSGYSDASEVEHDEYHSALEIDDTSGWKVFLVPALAILFLVGAVALFLLSGNDTAPDPRVQAQMRAKAEQAKQREYRPTPEAAAQPLPPDPEADTPTQNQAMPAQ